MRTVRPLLRPAAVAASLLAVVALSSCAQEDSDEPSAAATSEDAWSLWLSVGRPVGHGTILERGVFR